MLLLAQMDILANEANLVSTTQLKRMQKDAFGVHFALDRWRCP
jgi:hypothetical protein